MLLQQVGMNLVEIGFVLIKGKVGNTQNLLVFNGMDNGLNVLGSLYFGACLK